MKNKKYNMQELILLIYIIYDMIMLTIPVIGNIFEQYIMFINLGVGSFLFIINIKKYNLKSLLLIGLLIVNSIAGALINDTGFGSLITIINLYIMLLYSKEVDIRKNFINTSAKIVLIGNLIFLIMNKTRFNTNTIGYLCFVMTVFIFILYQSTAKKTFVFKLVMLGIFIANMFFLYLSDSRATLLGTIAFLMIMIFPVLVNNKKIFKTMTILIILGTILFPYIYVGMWKNNVEIDTGQGNKKFYSGRQIIWYRMMEEFEGKELYGIGSNFRVYSKDPNLNAHNSLFAIYMIYGLINFVIFLPLFIKFIWGMQANSIGKINRIAIAGIIGMIIVSYYETNLIWSDLNMFFVIFSCIAYNKDTIKKLPDKEKNKLEGLLK